jgi:hypothetical protein
MYLHSSTVLLLRNGHHNRKGFADSSLLDQINYLQAWRARPDHTALAATPSLHPVNARQAIIVEEAALMYLKGLSVLLATSVLAVWPIRPSVPLFQVFTAPGTKQGTKVIRKRPVSFPYQHLAC